MKNNMKSNDLKYNGVDVTVAVDLLLLVDKPTAIEIVNNIILPTIGSEADIYFWESVKKYLNNIE